MQTRTIPPDTYQRFFDSLSRIYAGSRGTLEILRTDLGAVGSHLENQLNVYQGERPVITKVR